MIDIKSTFALYCTPAGHVFDTLTAAALLFHEIKKTSDCHDDVSQVGVDGRRCEGGSRWCHEPLAGQ